MKDEHYKDKEINYKEIESLKIYRSGLLAGELKRQRSSSSFTYDQSFIAQAPFNGVSFSMPKTNIQYHFSSSNLPPFFAGILPEGLRMKAIKDHIKTSEDDLFSLYAYISHFDNIGDVCSQQEETKKNAKKNKYDLNQCNFYELLKQSYERSLESSPSSHYPGVQNKISASMISFPLKIRGKRKMYILKLNNKEHNNLVHNEYYSLFLAKKCHLDVANPCLVFDKDNNPGLLSERFDRLYSTSQKKFFSLHVEDACQFLDVYPSEKYRLSLSDIVLGIQKFSSAFLVDLLHLLNQYAFSYLLSNGDQHAKNISLLEIQDSEGNKRISLSPAYDMLSTVIYGDEKMALKIDGRDDNITRQHLIDFATRFKIPPKAMENSLNTLIALFNKNYEILRKIPMSNKDWNKLESKIQKRLKNLS